jgi:hypothetical protein
VREREHEPANGHVDEFAEDHVGAGADLIGRLLVAELFHEGGINFSGRGSCAVRSARTFVWDAYLAFGENSRWRAVPNGVLASGSDIIDNTGGLKQHFIPLLSRG